MCNKYQLIIPILLIASQTFGQMSQISGTVIDFETEQSLEYAKVTVLHSALITSTNAQGAFQLDIPAKAKPQKILVSYFGYGSDTILLHDSISNYKIYLKPNSGNLNEVVVSGATKATLIRENPISIISISPKAIEQSNESNIIDALVKNAPGLNAVKTGANISKPFIRGLGYSRVLTLYDGIRQEGQQWGDEHGIEVDAYNIQRAELIKGPASLLYGSDAMAGVVSLFPFIPDEKDSKIHGKILSEYQSNNNLIGNGFNLHYSNKQLLMAVRGSYRMAKNYRNAIDGQIYNTNFDEKNLSALIGYNSKKGFSHLNFTLYDNLQGIPDGSRDSLTRKFTKQIYEGSDDDIKNRPIVSEEALNSYQLSPLHQHIQHYRIYMHNDYSLGKGNVNFSLGLQQNSRKENNHPTMPEQAGMHVRLNTLNYAFRYNAPQFKNIETAIGVNGMLQDNKSINATDFPIPDYQLYDGGLYGYAKWRHNKWCISGGIRYDLRQVVWNDFYVGTNPNSGFDKKVHAADTANASLQFPAYQKNFSGLSASLGATFQVSKQISIKANVGRGYRAPNITEMASNGLDPGAHIIYLGNKNFNPEFSLQEDIGASARFKNVSADLSFFNNNIQNYIYLTMLVDANGNPILDPQANKTYQYQQASAQLFGMEMWLSLHPEKWKGFRLDNSLSIVYGYNRKALYKGEATQGAYLPLIPPPKLLSSASQKISLASSIFTTLTPKIELEYTARQNKFLALNNTETATPAYTLLHIGLNATIKYASAQSMQIQFQINNLLDKAYQSNLSRLKYFEYYAQSPNGHLGMYNMGRNMCMKLIFPF